MRVSFTSFRSPVPAPGTLAAALTAFSLFASSLPASAAEVTVRPDLYERVAKVKRLFPPRSQSSADGLKSDDAGAFTTLDVFSPDASSGTKPAVLRIEGQIDKGDAEKVRKVLEDWTYYPLVVSFNSPGGVFAEAFRIAEVLRYDIESQDPRIGGLIVMAGDQCLSACAIAFAASVDRAHPDTDKRLIEKGGKLGFHMPYIPEGTDTSTAGAREMLGLGYDVATQMVALLQDSANPPELLLRMLRHRTASSFYVLGGDLEAWRMGFTPVAAPGAVSAIGPAGLDTDAIGLLCNLNLTAGPIRMSGAEDEFTYFQPTLSEGQRSADLPLLTQLATSGGKSFDVTGGWFACQIRLDDESKVGVAIRRGDAACGGAGQREPGEICAAPSTGVDTVSNVFLAEAYSCRDDVVLPGTFAGERQPKIKRDVYLRDAPGRSGQVVTTLAADSAVEVTGCRVTADDQGVWYAVSRPGAKGWVSARFVGGQAETFAYRGERFAIDPPAGGEGSD
ncbi:SH3 domain-containing protein [Jiella avicenniae]|uniref:SH3 domain-containing protein n=1 Tax=Jiella avicenniae TaxID=2907202 RepID=A0A9X1P0J2_9HYPH|nr:SH3 domain-containing protein [Jiella avicenniae]MCE7027096.1 SH3 domain-containing protein [Jiella avicenniae]